jgi:type 2 lantibiotic biosynthesis protein LanM
MFLSEEELLMVFTKSLSLGERINLYNLNPGKGSFQGYQHKIDEWCQIISSGDRINFNKRFLWNDLHPDQAYSALCDQTSTEAEIITGWPETLNDCLKAAAKAEALANERRNGQLLDGAAPWPFQEILIPFVYYGREQLKEKAGEDYHYLTEEAHINLEKSLLVWLYRINALSLEFEYSAFRASSQTNLRRIFKLKEGKLPKAVYESFVESWLNEGLQDYFKEYTVLARLVATGVESWIETVTELISRIKKDKAQIEAAFNNGKEIDKVTEVKASLSDRHNGGRCVMILTFDSGLKLVYKPKDLSVEQAYTDLIIWLNANGSPTDFKTFKVLNYQNYGWAEFVAEQPLQNKEEARKFYSRSGCLLCLMHILGATDLHHENIIGSGEYPVLIDLETILHPFPSHHLVVSDRENAEAEANSILNDSVLRTGLVPIWQLDDKGQAYDVSGLGESMPQQYSTEGIKWEHVNTDYMQVQKGKVDIYSLERHATSPIKDTFNLDKFKDEFIAGFSEMYRFFMEEKEAILSSCPWQALADKPIRFIFRSTKVYGQLHYNLLHPEYLRSGMDRSVQLDILYSGMTSQEAPPVWWPLVEVEQDAMERMDVPHFSTRPDSDGVDLPRGKSTKGYFPETSFARVTRKVDQLNEQELKRQVEIIEGSLRCRVADDLAAFPVLKRKVSVSSFSPLTREQALQKAMDIADMLRDKAIAGKDGSLTWIAPRLHPKAKKFLMEPVSYDLYEGVAGIALFFAALFKITQQQKYKDLALGSLKIPFRQVAEGAIIDKTKIAGVGGGFTGYGSLAYSFLQAGILMEDSTLTDAAAKTASLISEKAIAEDTSFDVMYGTAGTILALLNLYSCFQDKCILKTLTITGNHLLKNRTISPSGLKVWATDDNSFLTGFSHGASGIGYALGSLYEVTQEVAFKDAATEAFAFERSVFDAKENNWPDFRNSGGEAESNQGQKSFACSWCHGATGIGLARIASPDFFHTKEIKDDIHAAVETTKKHLLPLTDHVCCGNFGRLELLLAASLQFSDDQLLSFTLNKAGELIKLSEVNGGFSFNPPIGFTPGFFQGISGIGYQILRLAYPDVLPSVLTLK